VNACLSELLLYKRNPQTEIEKLKECLMSSLDHTKTGSKQYIQEQLRNFEKFLV